LDRVFKIKKALLIPLAIDAGLVFILLLVSFFRKSSVGEVIFLIILMISLSLIVLECIFREVAISGEGLAIKKLLRRKRLGWGDITDVGALVLRKKVYLVLTTTKGFHIISNAYDDYTALVKGILEHVEAERVEESVKTLIDKPVRKISDIVSAWVGAAVLLVVLWVKIFMF
jgi:hypothetical protein